MKLLACDLCLDVFGLGQDWRQCRCGNASGHYLPDDSSIEVRVGNDAAARIVGLPNDVRYGREQSAPCYIIPFSAPGVRRL